MNVKRNIIIILGINALGVSFYFLSKYLLGQQATFSWIYFGSIFLLSLITHITFKYLDYRRVNNRLKEFQQEKKVRKKVGDIFFSGAVKLTAWIMLIVLTLIPSFKLAQGSILEQKQEIVIIENKTVITVPFKVEFTEISKLAEKYGLEQGVILSLKDKEAELLLFKYEFETEEDLLAKRIKINEQNQIIYEEDLYLSDELLGYSLSIIYGNSSSMNYLLGYRSREDKDEKKLYSDLLVLDKELAATSINFLQSYSFHYDRDAGMVPQGNIPTIIDHSIDIIGDYIIYQDVDLYWKVQNIKTKVIYTSNENNSNLDEVNPNYMARGSYIHILHYKDDNIFLAFNTVSKEFEILDVTQLRLGSSPKTP